jgi:hypothetical protein
MTGECRQEKGRGHNVLKAGASSTLNARRGKQADVQLGQEQQQQHHLLAVCGLAAAALQLMNH